MTTSQPIRVALLLTLFAITAQAQESRGRVQGAVADATGAVLPGASVVLQNDNTGVAATRTTNRDGRYLFDYVDPGAYTVTVTLAGFNTAIQKNVRVEQRADLTVDVKLEVGGLNETVVVTESPVAIQFTTGTKDLTVEQQMVTDLPSFTANPLGLSKLDPTVVNRGSRSEVQPFFHRTRTSRTSAARKYRNDVVLDGTPAHRRQQARLHPPHRRRDRYTLQQNAIDANSGTTPAAWPS